MVLSSVTAPAVGGVAVIQDETGVDVLVMSVCRARVTDAGDVSPG